MTSRQQPEHDASPRRVVLGTISSDSHTWNLLYLQLLIEEQGYTVANTGACTPTAELVCEAEQLRPDLIVISTVNGLGAQEAPDLARAIRSVPSLREVPLVIGGKLDTLGTSRSEDFPAVFEAGFDEVLVGWDAVPRLLDLLARTAAAGPAELLESRYAGARR
ncbi:MAG TPA: cobalamin B12-binding domain-containing protein [Actinocrinis sp.]|nr:cobalamin B12-binding domain-containing protein [Actinocrinis sp.]